MSPLFLSLYCSLVFLVTSSMKCLLLLSKFCSVYPHLIIISHPPAINLLCQPIFPISSIFKHCLSEDLGGASYKYIQDYFIMFLWYSLFLWLLFKNLLMKMNKWSPFLVLLYLIVCIPLLYFIFELQCLCFGRWMVCQCCFCKIPITSQSLCSPGKIWTVT